jgi:hypothetical protein
MVTGKREDQRKPANISQGLEYFFLGWLFYYKTTVGTEYPRTQNRLTPPYNSQRPFQKVHQLIYTKGIADNFGRFLRRL